MVRRVRLGLGVLGVAATAALLTVGQGAHAQTGPVTITRQALTLDAANAIVSAAVAQATQMGVGSVVVVDDQDGFMIAMARMDNARLTSINIAMDKAYTAAVRRSSTDDLITNFNNNPVGMASFLAQPHMTLLSGGIPITVNGTIVGGIGASGGAGGQDDEVANAGLAAIQH